MKGGKGELMKTRKGRRSGMERGELAGGCEGRRRTSSKGRRCVESWLYDMEGVREGFGSDGYSRGIGSGCDGAVGEERGGLMGRGRTMLKRKERNVVLVAKDASKKKAWFCSRVNVDNILFCSL